MTLQKSKTRASSTLEPSVMAGEGPGRPNLGTTKVTHVSVASFVSLTRASHSLSEPPGLSLLSLDARSSRGPGFLPQVHQGSPLSPCLSSVGSISWRPGIPVGPVPLWGRCAARQPSRQAASWGLSWPDPGHLETTDTGPVPPFPLEAPVPKEHSLSRCAWPLLATGRSPRPKDTGLMAPHPGARAQPGEPGSPSLAREGPTAHPPSSCGSLGAHPPGVKPLHSGPTLTPGGPHPSQRSPLPRDLLLRRGKRVGLTGPQPRCSAGRGGEGAAAGWPPDPHQELL